MSLLLLFAAGTNYTGSGTLEARAQLVDENAARRTVFRYGRGPIIYGTAAGGARGVWNEVTGVDGTGALAGLFTLSGDGVRSVVGTGTLASVITLSGAGVLNFVGTGALAGQWTLSGAGVISFTGSGALAPAVALAGEGVGNRTGTGALAVSIALDGSGTGTHTGAPEAVAGGGGGKRRRKPILIEDDLDETLDETLEEAIERETRGPSRREIQRLRRAVRVVEAQADAGDPQLARIAALTQAADALILRLQAAARDDAALRLAQTRMILQRLAEDAQRAEDDEQDDEEAILLTM